MTWFEIKPEEMEPNKLYVVYISNGLIWAAEKAQNGVVDIYKYVRASDCEE